MNGFVFGYSIDAVLSPASGPSNPHLVRRWALGLLATQTARRSPRGILLRIWMGRGGSEVADPTLFLAGTGHRRPGSLFATPGRSPYSANWSIVRFNREPPISLVPIERALEMLPRTVLDSGGVEVRSSLAVPQREEAANRD